MKTNDVIMEMDIYEAPECQVINIETECTILVGSEVGTGQATHYGFEEDRYVW